MKIKVFDRILLFIFTFIVILLSLTLLGIALNIIDYRLVGDLLSNATYKSNAFILGAIAVVLFLASIRLLVAGFSRQKPVSTLLMNTELGVIRVSVNTLDTLTQKQYVASRK